MARRRFPALLIASLILLSVLMVLWQPWLPRLKVGSVRINPKVSINAKKEYRIVVWDYELPLPWSKATYEETLTQRAEAFRQQHPNIIVHVVLRPWNEGDGALRDAVEQGEAPDVVSMPGGVRLLSSDFQVPLEHYLGTDQRDDLLPAARQGATHKHLWAFPSLISPARWVIRLNDTLPNPLTALTWAQWTEALAENRTKTGGGGLAANVLDPAFFYELMISATGQNLLGPDGTVQWTEESVQDAAEQLRTWVEKGLMPADVETAARTRLARFWDGKALGIAPANPWLLHHILERVGMLDSPQGSDPASTASTVASSRPLEKVQPSVSWIPPPQMAERLWVAATLSGYAVFRQGKYKGDDHTRAASLVAAYLSREMGSWTAARTFSVPAHQSSLESWLASSLLPEADMRLLLQWCASAVTPPVDDQLARLVTRVMTESVVPNLVAVLKGEMSASHFARELQTTPIAAIAEIAVP
jgi:hypothetical protein